MKINFTKQEFVTVGLIIEFLLVIFIVTQLYGSCISIENDFRIPFFIIIGLTLSNFASLWIVGFIKDFLWNKAGFHPEYDNLRLEDWWKKQNYSSNLSPYLGIVERIILVAAGLVSFQLFFSACGVWTTIKIAVDWQQFKEMKFRVINHIYLISTALSILLALIDVIAIHVLLNNCSFDM